VTPNSAGWARAVPPSCPPGGGGGGAGSCSEGCNSSRNVEKIKNNFCGL